MEYQSLERELRDWLSSIDSVEELAEAVAPLTEAEAEELSELGFFAEPTEEELAEFGPDFVEGVLMLLEDKVRSDRFELSQVVDWSQPVNPLIVQGLTLLRALAEVETRALAMGQPPKDLTLKATRVAEELADVFLQDLFNSKLHSAQRDTNHQETREEAGISI